MEVIENNLNIYCSSVDMGECIDFLKNKLKNMTIFTTSM